MTISDQIWDHYHRTSRPYGNDKFHKTVFCIACTTQAVSDTRDRELNREAITAATGQPILARQEADIRKTSEQLNFVTISSNSPIEVLDSAKGRASKVEECWKHLASCSCCSEGLREIAQMVVRVKYPTKKQLAREKEQLQVRATSGWSPNSSVVLPHLTPSSRAAALQRSQTLPGGNPSASTSRTNNTPPSSASAAPPVIAAVNQTLPTLYYEAAVVDKPWDVNTQAKFARDMCRLMVVCNIAWWNAEMPFWRYFFATYVPDARVPGREELSGRILDAEYTSILDNIKARVRGRFATGLCDGWKNVVKSAIIAAMINCEYMPFLMNTYDISATHKTAENLLDIVLAEINYAVHVLLVRLVAWCTDASGESAKMRRLLVLKMPWIIVVDCWAHQVNLIVGDVFKLKETFVEWIEGALVVVKWFNNHSRALGLLRAVMRNKLGKVLALFLPAITRWTSHYLSTTRLLLLQNIFKQLLLDSRDELLVVAGDTPAAREAAENVLNILEAPGFWSNLTKVQQHLEPLAIAANVTQSDHARLDTVLLTLANLYCVYADESLDPAIREAVHKSLEKRWKKIDQDIFILAVIFNPYIRTACFASTSPFRRTGTIRQLVIKCYKRIFNTSNEPNTEFTSALADYLGKVGIWSDESMDLAGHRSRARAQQKPLNLVTIWREWDSPQAVPPHPTQSPSSPLPPAPGPAPDGIPGLAQLAMTLLSVVPNSASVERIFSLFGIIHSKHRNRQSPEKVRKTALLRQDTLERFGRPSNRRKRQFTAIEDVELRPSAGSPPPPTEFHNDTAAQPAVTAGSSDFRRVVRDLDEEADEEQRDAEARLAAQALARADAEREGRVINDLPDGQARLLANLFAYPHPNDKVSYSYTVLEEFWTAGKDGVEAEVSYNEAEAPNPSV